ncbi:hypothetical protein DPMN_171546 [Dreissena polymorpha]|uniref:Uncharacterized protein n=1 Tax=Dreissena polymorpha TaxID=45954 RepID=A0A9D4DY74_DREPO|nr:hypothetical protein DPMN_171546 [Dreissena polymorpha]
MQTLVSESLHFSLQSPHFSLNQCPGRSHYSLKFQPSVSPGINTGHCDLPAICQHLHRSSKKISTQGFEGKHSIQIYNW